MRAREYDHICVRALSARQEAASNPTNAGLEEQVRRLKAEAESSSMLGTLVLGNKETTRGGRAVTESSGTLHDAVGGAQFNVVSEGAFATSAPHLRILSESLEFDRRDGECTKRMKVAASVAGHYVVKPSPASLRLGLQGKEKSRAMVLTGVHDTVEGEVQNKPLQQAQINERQAKVRALYPKPAFQSRHQLPAGDPSWWAAHLRD